MPEFVSAAKKAVHTCSSEEEVWKCSEAEPTIEQIKTVRTATPTTAASVSVSQSRHAGPLLCP